MTFDLEKAREANHDYLDLQYQLDSAEVEIERLREVIKTHNTREESALAEILMNELLVRQNAQIKELEDALVEERAKQFDVDEPCPARTHHEYCDILKGLCDGFPHMWKQCPRKPEKLDAARQQLQAEGKIGPDADAAHHECQECSEEFCDEDECPHDHTAEMVELNADHQYQPEAPRSWQITDERRDAIEIAEFAIIHLQECYPDCERLLVKPDLGTVKVLRAMLTEADHDKP